MPPKPPVVGFDRGRRLSGGALSLVHVSTDGANLAGRTEDSRRRPARAMVFVLQLSAWGAKPLAHGRNGRIGSFCCAFAASLLVPWAGDQPGVTGRTGAAPSTGNAHFRGPGRWHRRRPV